MDARRWTQDIIDLGDRIAGLTAARAAQLRRYLEQASGVRPDVLPVRREDKLPPPEPEVPPAPTERTVRLEGYEPARKLGVLREVRELTGLGLKETLALVSALPAVIKEGLPPAEAAQVKARLEAAGGQVSLG